jgi:hypothetical protein
MEFYCTPMSHCICTDETLWRVFGKDKSRIVAAHKDSSMKKAIAEHYLKGGVFRESAGFILREDIPHYGKRRYWTDFQKKFPSSCPI